MRQIAIGILATSILTALVLGVALTRRHVALAGAPSDGPDIALGSVIGNVLSVNAVTRAARPYSGFNLHLTASVSEGVTLTGIAGSVGGSILLVDSDGDAAPDTGSIFCSQLTPDVTAHQKLFGCVTLSVQGAPEFSTTARGLLGTFTFIATGDGCVQANLIGVPTNAPGAEVDDTFTVAIEGGSRASQDNRVNTAPTNILIGAGTIADCSGPALPSVGGGPISHAKQWSWLALSALAIGTLSAGVGFRVRTLAETSEAVNFGDGNAL